MARARPRTLAQRPRVRPDGGARPARRVPGKLSREELLGDALDVGRVHLPLVRLHDVAHQAADLLGVGEAERAEALLDEDAQALFIEAPRQVALAERQLEAELGGLGGAALARLLELRQRLLQLLP